MEDDLDADDELYGSAYGWIYIATNLLNRINFFDAQRQRRQKNNMIKKFTL